MSLEKSGTYTLLQVVGAGSAGAKNVCFEGLNKDIFLEVQNEKCI